MAAPEEFKIDRVLKREEWDGNNGRMVTYKLLFEGDNQTYKGRVELGSDPLPADGQTVKGWKNEGGKFGFATKGKGGGGGSGRTGAGGSEDYDRRPDHPLVMQQRIHTSCLSFGAGVRGADAHRGGGAAAAGRRCVLAAGGAHRREAAGYVSGGGARQGGRQTGTDPDGEWRRPEAAGA